METRLSTEAARDIETRFDSRGEAGDEIEAAEDDEYAHDD